MNSLNRQIKHEIQEKHGWNSLNQDTLMMLVYYGTKQRVQDAGIGVLWETLMDEIHDPS